MVYITRYEPIGKGRYRIKFDTGIECVFYRGDIAGLKLAEKTTISDEIYEHLIYEVISKRAKKRAMFLLEQMDRTEKQLREKLQKNEYPNCCVDEAINYVKRYHYLDDLRYAQNFVRYSQEKMSRQQIMIKLLQKGVGKDDIETALEQEYQSDEYEQIQQLLVKKKYEKCDSNTKEFQRMYSFLLRRGFKSSDILKAMKADQDTIYC